MEEEGAATCQVLEEKPYVAVGREVWKNISNLMWALENSQGKKICILHIHQPSPTIPICKYIVQTSKCLSINALRVLTFRKKF